MFSAVLIGTWAAFETLLGDLWEAAVNAHPNTLVDLKGDPKGIHAKVIARRVKDGAGKIKTVEFRGDRTESKPKSESKQIPVDAIRSITDGSFDLSNKMGSLLRLKYDFSNLGEARAAYSSAFWHFQDDIVTHSKIRRLTL